MSKSELNRGATQVTKTELPAKKMLLIWFLALFGGLFCLILFCVMYFELDPSEQPSPRLPWRNGWVSHRDIIKIATVTAGIGAFGMFGWATVRRLGDWNASNWKRLAKIVLTIAVLLSGLNYFYARNGLYSSQFAHRWDTFHYLLGPRYYTEIDYSDLYACALRDIPVNIIDDSWTVRDLRTYELTTAKEIREQELCENNFSLERRERWKHDLKLFIANRGIRILKGAIEDRGYNGTPFHSTVAGAIADRIPLTQATHQMVPLLDIFTLCAMLFIVCWGFGWQIGLVFALFFFTNPADRFAIIGGSFFRYQWLVALVIGLVALRRGRHATAGVFMTLSTLLNIFPFVFSIGVLVRGGVEWIRQRSLPKQYRRFLIAATLTGILGISLGAISGRGVENYVSWLDNMEKHNVERFQGFGTGLKFPFIYKGHHTKRADRFPESQRKSWFHERRHWYIILVSVLLILSFLFAARIDDDVEASTVLGFTIFFGLLGTVGYYFAVAAVLVLAFHRSARTLGGSVLLGLLFVASMLAHYALHETLYYRFMYNTVLSTAWSVWLALLLSWLTLKVTIPSYRSFGQASPYSAG